MRLLNFLKNFNNSKKSQNKIGISLIASFLLMAWATENCTAQPNELHDIHNWQIIGKGSSKAAISTNTIHKNGNQITFEFVYYTYNEELKEFYPSISGKRTDRCSYIDSSRSEIKILEAVSHDPITQATEELNEIQILDAVVRPYQTIMLNRYICDNLTPHEIKAGMTLIDARNIMDAMGFKILKQFYPEKFEFAGKEIGTYCGNGWSGCYVEFIHPKTKKHITIRVNYEGNTVIDSYKENK